MSKASIFLLLFGLFIQSISAQTLSDTLQEFLLKEQLKTSNDERINTYSRGQKSTVIDSIVLQQYQQQNLAQLLTQQTPIFIKSYGFNGLATLNIRGASAAQSQVLWNGVPITNAALGIADLASLPVFFIQNMQLVYGSSGSLFGSGNIGGTVSFETNHPNFQQNQNAQVFLGAGSFGQFQVGGKLEVSNPKYHFTTGLIAQSAQNNFSFKDVYGHQQTTAHAAFNGWSSVSSVAYKPNASNIFQFSVWLQQYDRQIPAALFESYSAKERNDQTIRLLLDWHHTSSAHWKWHAKTAFISDVMRYQDSTVQLNTRQLVEQSYSEIGWQYKKKHHSWLLMLPIHISWMPVQQTTKYLSQIAVAAAYQLDYRKWQFTENTRLATLNNNQVLLTGFTLSFKANQNFQWRCNLQQTYRTPSLNELYYSPGGNEQLKPEEGWNEEIGYRWSIKQSEHTSLVQDVAVYHRDIHNWIYWLGGAIWTPHNIASVSSSGLEIDHSFRIEHGISKWNIGINTSFVKAITTQSDIPNDGSIGKQIPYTPFINAVLHASLDYQKYSFQINQTYTGIRYFNTDETGLVNDYFTTNLMCNFGTTLFNKSTHLHLQVNNLFNEQYQVVSQRPMPGINFLIGMDCKF